MNLINEILEDEKKCFELLIGMARQGALGTFFIWVTSIIAIYAIMITILYSKEKITWSGDKGEKLLLDKWAYISLSLLTILAILIFWIPLKMENDWSKIWSKLFLKNALEIELLVREIQKTNPEILERFEEEFEKQKKNKFSTLNKLLS
jgi:hypothetical protein